MDEKINICRAFTFFKDKVNNYPAIFEEYTKDYITIGFFDWFNTKQVLNQYNGTLEKLYEYTYNLNEELKYYESYQNIFGFRCESNQCSSCSGNNITDDFFWKNSASLKFISLIQIEQGNLQKAVEKIERILNDYNNVSHIVYQTLDKNDIILCLSSKKYESAVKILNDLYEKLASDTSEKEEKFNISYSYTHFIYKTDELSDECIKDLDEEIPSICIKATLNNLLASETSIQKRLNWYSEKLYRSLYNNKEINDSDYVPYEILGDTDCRFIARRVKLKNILKLFYKDGLLSRNGEVFGKCFVTSMTSLNLRIEDVSSEDLKFNTNHDSSEELEKINNLYNTFSEELWNEFSGLKTQIKQILNYLYYEQNQHKGKSAYKMLGEPLYVALSLMNNKDNIESVGKGTLIVDDIFDFINNMYLNIQSVLRSDVRFFNISDFSVMTYYVPTKLMCFYSLLFNKISGFYNTLSCVSNYKYKFIIAPTNLYYTSVDQVWKHIYNQDKLITVKICERDFYNVNYLMFQSAHEVAHFVGGEDVRKRKNRLQIFCEFLFTEIIQSFIEYLEKKLKKFDVQDERIFSQYVNEVKNRFFRDSKEKMLTSYLKSYIKESNINEDEFYYLDNISKYIGSILNENVITDIINKYIAYYNDFILRESELSVKGKNKFINNLKEIKNQILNENKVNDIYNDLYTNDDCKEEMIKYLCSESFSDLCAILLFDVKVDGYYKYIFSITSDYDLAELKFSSILHRSSIVTYVLSNLSAENISSSYFSFLHGKDFKLKDYNEEDSVKRLNLIREFCTNIKNQKTSADVYAAKYIELCAKSLCEKIANQQSKDLHTKLKELYSEMCDDSIIDSINSINEFIESTTA